MNDMSNFSMILYVSLDQILNSFNFILFIHSNFIWCNSHSETDKNIYISINSLILSLHPFHLLFFQLM